MASFNGFSKYIKIKLDPNTENYTFGFYLQAYNSKFAIYAAHKETWKLKVDTNNKVIEPFNMKKCNTKAIPIELEEYIKLNEGYASKYWKLDGRKVSSI